MCCEHCSVGQVVVEGVHVLSLCCCVYQLCSLVFECTIGMLIVMFTVLWCVLIVV